jgi:hypothetical protein
MELTVKQLAERLLPVSPDEDLGALTRQLRHWTLGGLLETVGEVHVGAGRARKYDEYELYYAALAMELSRWRIPVGVSHLIVRMARDQNEHAAATGKGSVFSRAVAGEADIFLCIRIGSKLQGADILGGKYGSLMGTIGDEKWTADSPGFLAINLTTLFAPLRN